MRLSIEYEIRNPLLPKDYRRGYISLIKKALEHSNPSLMERYYSQRTLKPFTFCVYFPQLKGGENGNFNVGNQCRVTISTSSMELGTYLHNGFREVRTYTLFKDELQNELVLKRIWMPPSRRISSNEVVFMTASPVLVNNLGKADWYLLPGEEGFLEGLKFAVGEIAKAFLNRTDEVPVEFHPFEKDGKISIKRKVVRHYNMDMSSFVGVFKLKSDPEILQLIYDVGLGVRRSQGFGMLEVLRTSGQQSESP